MEPRPPRTPEEKAQRRAKKLRRLRKQLIEQMRKDIETLHKIIYGK